MDFGDLLQRYFAAADISGVTPAAIDAGTERMLVDLGMEKDRRKRFALWSLLYMLGEAPDLDISFKNEADRDAARNFMDMIAAAEGE